MRRRSRGPLPRRLLNPDAPSPEAILTHDAAAAISTEINDLVSNRKLLAALQHAKAANMHARYQALRNEASQVDMNYSYAEGFLPGVYFYKYLASVADVGGEDKDRTTDDNCHVPLRSVGHPKLQLKCWLPDTIVFGGTFPPVWLYSDQHGYIRKVIQFQDANVMEKLGNRRFENDPVVVFKEPQVVKTPSATTTGGNQIKLYNTLELKSALAKAIGSPVTFALQKYVKPKGPKAFIVRAVYKAGRPACGWTITNKAPFDAPHLPCLNRFCTLTATDDSCSFAKLTERAVADLMDVHVRYVEVSLRVSFESVVADYIKDDMGQWWLVQVKAFRLKTMRPTALLPKLGDAYDRSTVQDDWADDVVAPAAPFKKPPSSHHPTVQDKCKVHKMVPCKLCQVMYLQHEVAYKMTMKMMYETIARIQLRSTSDTNLSFLRHPKDGLESGLLYQTWNVCNLCYALYERDQALLQVETKFTAFLGCPTRLSTSRKGGVTITHDSNVARSQPMLTQVPTEFTLCRLMLFFTALYDIPKELYESETQLANDPTRPKRSRLYLRFAVLGFDCFVPLDAHAMLASTSIPSNEDDEPATCYWIPLNLMRCFHFFAPKTPLASKLRESSGLGSYLADEGTITIQLIRCTDPHTVDIDARRGHQQQPPPTPSSSFSTARGIRRRGLKTHKAAVCDAQGSYSVLLGSTKIQLYQFRSAYVSKTDVYTSMSSGELFNLKANVGFERIRVVNSKHILARYPLRQYFGVFVPDLSYVVTDKLCTEWVDNMNAVTEDATLYVPKAHLDQFRAPSSSAASTSSLRDANELEDLIEAESTRQVPLAEPPKHRRNPLDRKAMQARQQDVVLRAADRHNATPAEDVVFDSTHRIYVRGALDAMQAFYGSPGGVCTVRLSHAATSSRPPRTVEIDLADLQTCRTIDGTFNIDTVADAVLVPSNLHSLDKVEEPGITVDCGSNRSRTRRIYPCRSM
ncbi:hypothetical protein DYB35_003678 [Aphanomyces astaci]|uniref:Uncharacterized protein n=1 Tax=Aphanomyces astaci TaxID=112090 RepID=A0A3R7BKV3_APHAT|nr:hypothetical protein DYB35_003678 [Aphanomyces astaci]